MLMRTGACWVQTRRVLDPLELESWIIVSSLA